MFYFSNLQRFQISFFEITFMAKRRGQFMSGTHSNSFIFDQSCTDFVESLFFFILNFCSRLKNFKIFADSEKGTSRFSFQQLEELRAFWDKIKRSFSLPIGI